jgi:hypothetical protein
MIPCNFLLPPAAVAVAAEIGRLLLMVASVEAPLPGSPATAPSSELS